MKSGEFPASCNGIYRTPVDAVPLRDAARRASLPWIVIDLRGVRERHGLFTAFSRACRFPDEFGGNWDALADSLQDLSWLQAQGWVLQLQGVAECSGAAPEVHTMLQEILTSTAGFWQLQGRVFIVFADGPAGLPPYPAP